jgi:hypothetical protein
MSQRNVEILVGRLVTDEGFLEVFAASPQSWLAAAVDAGVELTPVERQALACFDVSACERFASQLDPRIRKVNPRRV